VGRDLPGRRHDDRRLHRGGARGRDAPHDDRTAGPRNVHASAREAADLVDDHDDHDDHDDPTAVHHHGTAVDHHDGAAVHDDDGTAVDHDDAAGDDDERAGRDHHLGLIEAFGDA
jgi:hypothetical protein